ncbi:MAG: acetoin utilization protein AcuC [bacterium]
MSIAFIFSEEMMGYDYGPCHPLRIERLGLTLNLIQAYGLLDHPEVIRVKPRPVGKEVLQRFHTPAYLDALQAANSGVAFPGLEQFGIGPGDNPVFKGMYDWSCLIVGASIEAGLLVAEGKARVAFNIGGGLHHARPNRASGFCYVNDPVLLILELLDRGLKVVYLDVDVHHGDGVQWAFYDTDRVLTISLHQDGRTLFPGTGAVEEMGRGAGAGYSVNIPLWPGTDDWLYLRAFDEVVLPLIQAYKPDIVVTQLGVDTFHGDPLAALDLTTQGFVRVLEKMKENFPRWVALGGGGYEMTNVARAWTLAWAVMTGQELPQEIPEALRAPLRELGYSRESLMDEYLWPAARREVAEEFLETTIHRIRRSIFPVHGL